MELRRELIYRETGKMIAENFENLQTDYKDIFDLSSIRALQKMKDIITNDALSDFECIEAIIYVFESIGRDGGNRHDF